MLGAVESAAVLLIGKDRPVVPSETEPACSFCGRKRREVRLGAGPEAFICDGCVGIFTDIFRKEKGTERRARLRRLDRIVGRYDGWGMSAR